MTEIHYLIIGLIFLVLWLTGYIRLTPNSKSKAERELAKTVFKENKGIFK